MGPSKNNRFGTPPRMEPLRPARRATLLLIALASALSALFITSCATQTENFPTLVNQGILGLSTSNAYLGANLYLARELERSTYLFNFFKARGAPVAIEIEQESMSPTPRMLMYYPSQRETYAADVQLYRAPGGTMTREWIVRGPYSIEHEDFRKLARLDAAMSGEPVFVIWGKPFRFRFQTPEARASAQKTVAAIVPEIPPPTPTPRPAGKKPSKVISIKGDTTPAPTPTPTFSPESFRPLSSDQQAIMVARGYSRRANNGDVLHDVKNPGETAEKIVKWYTGSTELLGEIADLNQVKPSQELIPGNTFTVPLKYVKQFKAMPAPSR